MDGEGRFQPNEEYQPATPESPTDTADAALRLAARGEVDTDAVFAVLREAEFAVAMDEGSPVVAPARDDVPSLPVTTAPAHQARVRVGSWLSVGASPAGGSARRAGRGRAVQSRAPTPTRLVGAIVSEQIGSHAE
ncbi:hypothetical protein [Kutzneria buriramensis]|uniref:Uncharacterized protein n=1 Tax=Kutzneria buriramensis TaxID=1045776 RepID=A0A3E0HIC2_9PSEU|nr:hypothetical protein [Kutzneria buriramensis]REH46158.1 hypothetical protein BCF44_107291 [Kutzneria buriramensis]